MKEQEHTSNEIENTAVDEFVLTKERRLETVNTNINLILRRCKRQEVQPREMMLRAFQDREGSNARLGDIAEKINQRIKAIPDFDLDDTDFLSQATDELFEIYTMVIERQYTGFTDSQVGNVQEMQARKHWQKAGLFSYELGENHELVLHIPPMPDSPQLMQMKDSLSELAKIVADDKEIKEVRGSSLLLEHPIAKHLGFEIDEGSDEGFNPNFRLSREKFLEQFGK